MCRAISWQAIVEDFNKWPRRSGVGGASSDASGNSNRLSWRQVFKER